MFTMNQTFPKSKVGKWPIKTLNPSGLILGFMYLKNCALLSPKIASITRAHIQLMLSFLLCDISNIILQYQGADTVKNDGIYSRYFTDYRGNGRYSLKVHAEARNNTARLSLRQPQNKALYIPGYIENGKWH